MNFCNFTKVFMARTSKDTSSMQWIHNKEDQKMQQPMYNNHLPIKSRFQNYSQIVSSFPNMQMPFKIFQSKLKLVQNYITKSNYYTQDNKCGEKKEFLENFSLPRWNELSVRERRLHTYNDCDPCKSLHASHSAIHKSGNSSNILENCTTLVDGIAEICSQSTAVPTVLKALSPILEQKFEVNTREEFGKALNLEDKEKSELRRKRKRKAVSETARNVQRNFEQNEVDRFLASGKSFQQLDRDRFAITYETKYEATERVKKQISKETDGRVKPKRHHGSLDKYKFDREKFLADLSEIPDGHLINWTQMARKYNLTINGVLPKNGGQVMVLYAKKMGINTNKFNSKSRISGRDYQRRIRRAKKRLASKVSLPSHKSAKKLKTKIKQKLENNELYIGEKVVPKTFSTTKIDDKGTLVTSEKQVYTRKVPLNVIIREETNRQMKLGIIRGDTDYESLKEYDARKRLLEIGETAEEKENAKGKLKIIERTRQLKMWHDHSDVLNHSYINFMVSFMYDTANFLTDEEYVRKYPERPRTSVQSLVERPRLYLFGQSPSTDADQMTYTATRLEDLENNMEYTLGEGITYFHALRVFSGDGPARQFESGQQRGGNFPCICGVHAKDHTNLTRCYRMPIMSLDDRAKLVRSGSVWKRGELNPFKDLSKSDLIEELESRGIDTDNQNKSELKESLTETLHGIQRPPALLTLDGNKTATDLNFPQYEVLGSEPLHDLCNVIQNIMTELPSILKDKTILSEYEKLYKSTLAEKKPSPWF